MAGRLGAGGARYVVQRLGLLAVFGIVLFATAGRWSWPRAWAYLGSVLALEVCTLALMAVHAPGTLNARGTNGVGVKAFDKVFAALWLLLSLAAPAVAGLDAGRHPARALPWCWFWVGLWLVVPAVALATWAMLENEHFEQLVRIQRDRAHHVVSSGPYRLVRHPGYLAAIVGALASPPMLGSAWMFLPAGLIALLFVVRTRLEDATLQRELDGYTDYARRTRYRLVPFVW